MSDINPFHYERNWAEQDFSDWEIDEYGNLGYIYFNGESLLHITVKEMVKWIVENCESEWFWSWENFTNEKSRLSFYFKNLNDAIAFKIVWNGETHVVY